MTIQRLQKLIAEAGIASRRHAEEMIAAGEVSVNGEIVREPGTKADPNVDHIKVQGRLINPLLANREKVYVLLNKPRGYLTSVSDPEERPLVTDLVPPALGRLYPVGRLDFNTEGLLILTNDGALTNHITAARNKVAKVYEAKVKGKPPEQAIEQLRRGVVLEEDGRKVRTAPADIRLMGGTESNNWYEVVLREGRNQQIRRMFDSIGHSVVKLRRVSIGGIMDELLPVGAYRLLDPEEVRRLLSPAATRSASSARSKIGQAKVASAKAAPTKSSPLKTPRTSAARPRDDRQQTSRDAATPRRASKGRPDERRTSGRSRSAAPASPRKPRG